MTKRPRIDRGGGCNSRGKQKRCKKGERKKNLRVKSRTNTLLVAIMLKYDTNDALPENPWLSNMVLDGCINTRPWSWEKYLIVLASGSSSTAPETDVANFLSGNWMRQSCGAK